MGVGAHAEMHADLPPEVEEPAGKLREPQKGGGVDLPAAPGAEALSECPRIELCVPVLTPEQFAASPLNLSLSGLFFETDIPYTYEIYRAHLEVTRAYAADRPNMILAPDPAPAFRNLSYTIVGERLVIVSKNKSPAIHFVIHHPKMVQAFLGFQPPIREPDEA